MTRTRPPQSKRLKRTKVPLVPTEEVRKTNGAGRTGYYKPTHAEDARELVGTLGARNKDLADYFEVSVGTIEYWIRTKPEFERAVKKGRIEKGLKVSQSLYHKAIGYSHPDVHIMSNRVKTYDSEGNLIEEHTEPLMVPIMKHYPPDTAAAVKYLSIIFRETWAENTNINHNLQLSGTVNVTKIEEISMDQLTPEIKEMLFALNMRQLSDAQSN